MECGGKHELVPGEVRAGRNHVAGDAEPLARTVKDKLRTLVREGLPMRLQLDRPQILVVGEDGYLGS